MDREVIVVSIQQTKRSVKILRNVVKTTVQVWEDGGAFSLSDRRKTLLKIEAKIPHLLTNLYTKKMYQLNIVVHRYILIFQVFELF